LDEKDTKVRILDTAEKLFADNGFAATSLRQITADAAVNLAAVHYHFGSKDDLIRAVFARRIGPLNRERLELLDRLEENRGGPAELRPIIEAFIGPPLRMSQDSRRGGRVFMRLLGHAMNQPSDKIRGELVGQFREVGQRFRQAFARVRPGLSETEVLWRMLFMIGAMAHTMSMADQLPKITDGMCDPRDTEALLDRLVPFLTAGMEAPAPEPAAGRSA